MLKEYEECSKEKNNENAKILKGREQKDKPLYQARNYATFPSALVSLQSRLASALLSVSYRHSIGTIAKFLGCSYIDC
jgi:hypothetical protein